VALIQKENKIFQKKILPLPVLAFWIANFQGYSKQTGNGTVGQRFPSFVGMVHQWWIFTASAGPATAATGGCNERSACFCPPGLAYFINEVINRTQTWASSGTTTLTTNCASIRMPLSSWNNFIALGSWFKSFGALYSHRRDFCTKVELHLVTNSLIDTVQWAKKVMAPAFLHFIWK